MNTETRIVLKNRHKQILELIKDNRLRLAVAMVCSLAVAAADSLLAYLVKPILNGIFIANDSQVLIIYPVYIILIFFIRGGGQYCVDYFMNYVGQGIIRKLRDQLYAHIQTLPLAFFQKEKTGVLMSRITNDVNLIKTMVSSAVTSSIRDLFKIIGLTCVIFYMDWQLALIAMVILPIAFFPIVIFGRRLRRTATGCQQSMAEMSAFLHETLAGNKIVKAFSREQYEIRRFFAKTRRLFRFEMKSVRNRSLPSSLMEILAGLGIAAILWYKGFQIISGSSTLGDFGAFITAVLMLYEPVKKLSRLNNALQEGLAATDRVFDVLETASDITEAPDGRQIATVPHCVRFHDVHFTYGDKPVLTGINLNVQAGEIVALVGMSGGGKTTLVNLIPRFFDVTQGQIAIDGLDIRDATLASLRSQIAIVTQEPILFDDTIRNNIAYGNADADEAAILDAARSAYAHEFIQRTPKGLDTTIGELGSRLSGGEKQRLCVARALLKDAPILILDEATSSLDSESEKWVQKALENLMRGRTTFVIAHRLATIGHADRIVVIADGRIVEEGRHGDLIRRRGEYFKLYQMQFEANAI